MLKTRLWAFAILWCLLSNLALISTENTSETLLPNEESSKQPSGSEKPVAQSDQSGSSQEPPDHQPPLPLQTPPVLEPSKEQSDESKDKLPLKEGEPPTKPLETSRSKNGEETPIDIVIVPSSTAESSRPVEAEGVKTHKDDSVTGASAVESKSESTGAPEKVTPGEIPPPAATAETKVEQVNETETNKTAVPEVPVVEVEIPLPSFEEWKNKIKQEQGNVKQTEPAAALNGDGTHSTVRTRNGKQGKLQKNFASSECGAKILASNKEAQKASNVLTESKDDYMLNPCSVRIWFVVELCQPVHPYSLDIANFELFSNIPKEFRVQFSDRYPVKDWTKQFTVVHTAEEQRTEQNFPITTEPSAEFAKYVRVEVNSFYGTEHYCPISLFRLFGTTMDDIIDDPDEDGPDQTADDDNKGYLIDKLRSFIVGTPGNGGNEAKGNATVAANGTQQANETAPNTNATNGTNSVNVPSVELPEPLVVVADNSTQSKLTKPADSPAVTQTPGTEPGGGEKAANTSVEGVRLAVPSPVEEAFHGLGPLCDLLLFTANSSRTKVPSTCPAACGYYLLMYCIELYRSRCAVQNSFAPAEINSLTSSQPVTNGSVVGGNGTQTHLNQSLNATQRRTDELGLDDGGVAVPTGAGRPESIIMRLSNRVKALETNLSLTSRYLEELSQRYRKQMDDMQRAFNKTISALLNTSKAAEDRDHKHHERIGELEERLTKAYNTIEEMDFNVDRQVQASLQLHLALMLLEIAILSAIFWFCLRRRAQMTVYTSGLVPNGRVPNGRVPNGHVPNGHVKKDDTVIMSRETTMLPTNGTANFTRRASAGQALPQDKKLFFKREMNGALSSQSIPISAGILFGTSTSSKCSLKEHYLAFRRSSRSSSLGQFETLRRRKKKKKSKDNHHVDTLGVDCS